MRLSLEKLLNRDRNRPALQSARASQGPVTPVPTPPRFGWTERVRG